jgi:protein HIRA/HIR1
MIIKTIGVLPTGSPVLNCSNGAAMTYDPRLACWTQISDKWWAEGSDAWTARQQRTTAPTQFNGRNYVTWVESNIDIPQDTMAGQSRPSWWNTALTLGHLETRLHACNLLDSPVEYKQNLMMYAKKIADEGFRGKAEELIKELLGPVYWFVIFSPPESVA